MARLFTSLISKYASIKGISESEYVRLLQVERTLAGSLSLGTATSLKALVLQSKPCQEKSQLIGKVYAAVGQAGGAVHTIEVLQAYQAELLKFLDQGVGMPLEPTR